jgi:hypothetical protein
MKFMVGCDCEWNFEEDGSGGPDPAAAGGGGALLQHVIMYIIHT